MHTLSILASTLMITVSVQTTAPTEETAFEKKVVVVAAAECDDLGELPEVPAHRHQQTEEAGTAGGDESSVCGSVGNPFDKEATCQFEILA